MSVGSPELQTSRASAPEESPALYDMVGHTDAHDLLAFVHDHPELFTSLVLEFLGPCDDGDLQVTRRWLGDWGREREEAARERMRREAAAAERRRLSQAASVAYRRQREASAAEHERRQPRREVTAEEERRHVEAASPASAAEQLRQERIQAAWRWKRDRSPAAAEQVRQLLDQLRGQAEARDEADRRPRRLREAAETQRQLAEVARQDAAQEKRDGHRAKAGDMAALLEQIWRLLPQCHVDFGALKARLFVVAERPMLSPMLVLKQGLDLVREAAAAAAEARQSWAAEDALRVLVRVPCAPGLGWRLASLLRYCAPARTDLASLEGVRTDKQRCLLVRNAAGERISVLMRALQTQALRDRQGLPAVAGTPRLRPAALTEGDRAADESMAQIAAQLMRCDCFRPGGTEGEITSETILQAGEACPELVRHYVIDSPAGRCALEETQRGYHRNVNEMAMSAEAAGRTQRLQLIGHTLVDVGRLRVYGYSDPNGPSLLRHWLQQAGDAIAATTTAPPPRRVLLEITELEIYFQIWAVMAQRLRIISDEPASGGGWLEPNPARDGGGDGLASAHAYGHPGGPTLALTANFGAPPAPPLDVTPSGEVALGGQLLHRGARAASLPDQLALLMPLATVGMGQLWDLVATPAFGRPSRAEQCDLLDTAGDRGVYPNLTHALSPVLYAFELPTPTLQRSLVYRRVSAYEGGSGARSHPRQARAVRVWGEASRLQYHHGHPGDPCYMTLVSWTVSPWGNLLAAGRSSGACAATAAAPAAAELPAMEAEADSTPVTAPVTGPQRKRRRATAEAEAEAEALALASSPET